MGEKKDRAGLLKHSSEQPNRSHLCPLPFLLDSGNSGQSIGERRRFEKYNSVAAG